MRGCGDEIVLPGSVTVCCASLALHEPLGVSRLSATKSPRPLVPISMVRVGRNVDPEPRAQQLNLGALLHRHHVNAVALVRVDVEALPKDAPHPAVRDWPVVLAAIAFDESGRDFRDGNHGSPGATHKLGDDFENVRFDEEPAICNEILLCFLRHGAELGSKRIVGDHAHERQHDLIEPRLDRPGGQALIELDLMPPMKAIQQELIAQLTRFLLEAVGKIDRNIGA